MVNLMLTKLIKIQHGTRAGYLRNSLITGRKIVRFTSCSCSTSCNCSASCFVPVTVAVAVSNHQLQFPIASCSCSCNCQFPVAQALRLEDKLDGATNFRGMHLYMFKIVSLS
jgi:hypothetical protein